MVKPQYEAVEKIVSSPSYNQIVDELIATLNIAVDEEYESIFARLDSAKLDRSGLSAEQIDNAVREDSESIIKYSKRKFKSLQCDTDDQDHSDGDEPRDGDKDVVVSVGNYARGFVLTNVIEYLLAKEGPAQLLGYVKASKIPKAKAYVSQILGFID
jgi:hypothetical protein